MAQPVATDSHQWQALRDALSVALTESDSSAIDAFLQAAPADDERRLRAFQSACLLPSVTSLDKAVLPATPALAVCARLALQLRIRLEPHLYSLRALEREYTWPVLRPHDGDSFLLGDALLVAPVLAEGARQRTVTLPDGLWFDFWTDAPVFGGQLVNVVAPPERLPLFVRAGAVLPLSAPTPALAPQSTMRLYPGDHESTIYEDGGGTQDYADGNFRWTYITSVHAADGLRLTRRTAGRYLPSHRHHTLQIFGLAAPPAAVVVDRRSAPLWYYNTGRLECAVPDDFSAVEISFS